MLVTYTVFILITFSNRLYDINNLFCCVPFSSCLSFSDILCAAVNLLNLPKMGGVKNEGADDGSS